MYVCVCLCVCVCARASEYGRASARVCERALRALRVLALLVLNCASAHSFFEMCANVCVLFVDACLNASLVL